MVILSQNKKWIVNFENLVEIRFFPHDRYPFEDNMEGYDLYGIIQSGEDIILGIYDTEERAKEVLLEIATHNASFNLFKCSDAEKQKRALEEFLEKGMIFDIYEMPEEWGGLYGR